MEFRYNGQVLSGPNGLPVISMSYDAYQALTDDERNADVVYLITDAKQVLSPTLTEYDTDDGWHVRKWSNGYIEMLYHEERESIGKDFEELGSWFWMRNVLGDRPYPVPLVERYTEIASGRLDYAAIFSPYGFSDQENAIGAYAFFRPFSTKPNTDRAVFDVTVTGRWR